MPAMACGFAEGLFHLFNKSFLIIMCFVFLYPHRGHKNLVNNESDGTTKLGNVSGNSRSGDDDGRLIKLPYDVCIRQGSRMAYNLIAYILFDFSTTH